MNSSRRRTSSRRKTQYRLQRKVILVLTEGEVTEREYLKHIARMSPGNRLATMKLGSHHSNPSYLVDKAVQTREFDKRRTRSLYDEIWCVFDYDEHFPTHSDLHALISQAESHGLEVSVSNPCFELWLVLHQQSQTAEIGRRQVQRRAHDIDLVSGKHILASAWPLLESNHKEATDRAQALDLQHSCNGLPPRSNPSTDVWRLAMQVLP